MHVVEASLFGVFFVDATTHWWLKSWVKVVTNFERRSATEPMQ